MAAPTVGTSDVARGLMLLGVFHIHALVATIDHLGDSPNGRLAYLQVKLLAPHVAVFFALAGMSSRWLGHKPWPVVLQRSLMLLLLAWFSHLVGVLIQHMLWTPWPQPLLLAKTLLRPLVYGIGHATFVPWFLVVLAVARLFGYAWARGWRVFLVATGAAAVLVAAARAAGAPDNVFDWKHWPAAVALFLVGMRLAPTWRVPHMLGVLSLVGFAALTLVNRPSLWREGPCLDCEVMFIAQPLVGEFGFVPLYFVIEALAVIALLWLAQLAAASPLQRLLAYMGRNAIGLLLLHGWVILSFYGLTYWLLPDEMGAELFLVIALLNPLLHLALYCVVAAPIDRCVGICSAASHHVVTLLRLALRAWRRAKSLPAAYGDSRL